MSPKRILAALLVTAGLVLATPAPAAFDSYLKIDGVPGESKDAAHRDWIEVDSYQFEAVRHAAGAAGSARAGKVSFSDLTFTKLQDKSSPKLFQAAATGKHFPTVVLHVRKSSPDKTGQPFLVVTMHEVLVSSARASGGGGLPTETVTLNFGKVEYQYAPQHPAEPDGRAASLAPAAAGAAVALAPTPAPPKITGASASAPFTGLAVAVTITSTGPCQGAFVDYGDGSISEGHTLTGTSTTLPAHTYPSPGAKTIKVGGRDAPYWPQAQQKAQPHAQADACTGWAPEVHVMLRSIVERAPALAPK
ncbi:MAG TPA: type VI secretion system tube protein Hcp [Thermoanaerobaculia bacterium]|jgi:type VI secretion system Hcp family effector